MDTKFRTAINGFNKSDVATYLQELIERTKNEKLVMSNELSQITSDFNKLKLENQSLLNENALLKEQLDKLQKISSDAEKDAESRELELYRRAESAERIASEKAAEIESTAEVEAAKKLAEAELKAESILSGAEAKAQNVQNILKKFSEQISSISTELNEIE